MISSASTWSGVFQSTLPVGGATENSGLKAMRPSISIHAPRGGSDLFFPSSSTSPSDISIHAPRGGSDCLRNHSYVRPGHFNPRSPWGERLWVMKIYRILREISIHAPRGGSDRIGLHLLS